MHVLLLLALPILTSASAAAPSPLLPRRGLACGACVEILLAQFVPPPPPNRPHPVEAAPEAPPPAEPAAEAPPPEKKEPEKTSKEADPGSRRALKAVPPEEKRLSDEITALNLKIRDVDDSLPIGARILTGLGAVVAIYVLPGGLISLAEGRDLGGALVPLLVGGGAFVLGLTSLIVGRALRSDERAQVEALTNERDERVRELRVVQSRRAAMPHGQRQFMVSVARF